MCPELKFVIKDSKRVIETISKETRHTNPVFMIRALSEFRQQVNAAISRLIEDPDPDDTCDNIEEDDGGIDEEEIEVSPKKQKK